MTDKPTAARNAFGDVAPALAAITDEVLFGEVWERPGLGKRARSLVTLASLLSLYRTNELAFIVWRALEFCGTREEFVESITLLAFYAGGPAAMTALQIARKAFD